MTASFEKNHFNEDFDYKTGIQAQFAALGFNNVNVQTSFSNGLSHYISVFAKVLNHDYMPNDVFVYENNTALITVRISDHFSNLDRYGVVGNQMTMAFFTKLVNDKIIAQ